MSRESSTVHLTTALPRLLLVSSVGTAGPTAGGWQGIAIPQLHPAWPRACVGSVLDPSLLLWGTPEPRPSCPAVLARPGPLCSAFRQVSLPRTQAWSPWAQRPAACPPSRPHPPAHRPPPRLYCSRSRAWQGFLSEYFRVCL